MPVRCRSASAVADALALRRARDDGRAQRPDPRRGQVVFDLRHQLRRRLRHHLVADARKDDQLRVGQAIGQHQPRPQRRDHVVAAPDDQRRRADARDERAEVLQDEAERGDALRLSAEQLHPQRRQLEDDVGRRIENPRRVGKMSAASPSMSATRGRIIRAGSVTRRRWCAAQASRWRMPRRRRRQTADLLRVRGGVKQRDRAAHRMPDDVDRAGAVAGDHARQHRGVARGRVLDVGLRRAAEARQVEHHDAPVLGQRREHGVPVAHAVRAEAVDQEQRRLDRRRARARPRRRRPPVLVVVIQNPRAPGNDAISGSSGAGGIVAPRRSAPSSTGAAGPSSCAPRAASPATGEGRGERGR